MFARERAQKSRMCRGILGDAYPTLSVLGGCDFKIFLFLKTAKIQHKLFKKFVICIERFVNCPYRFYFFILIPLYIDETAVLLVRNTC